MTDDVELKVDAVRALGSPTRYEVFLIASKLKRMNATVLQCVGSIRRGNMEEFEKFLDQYLEIDAEFEPILRKLVSLPLDAEDD